MLYKAATSMVIGIKNSTMLALIAMILKTERNKAKVCPKVKNETKISILFQFLNS
jgi:hypothetical protein